MSGLFRPAKRVSRALVDSLANNRSSNYKCRVSIRERSSILAAIPITRLVLILTGFAIISIGLVPGENFASMQARDVTPPPVPAPAAGIQLQPQIAKGSNMSLAVWSDKRTVLTRYVPNDNAGLGGNGDIYAARFDGDGVLIDTSPIAVNQDIYDQYYPHVAWNGQNWLVTWVTIRKTNQFQYDVKAVRVAPDGRVLDANPIVFTTGQDISPTYLSIASDGNNWAVIFGAGSYESKIFGSRVAADGTLIDATPKILHDDAGNFTAPFQADIAYSNNQFLISWEIVVSGGHAVRAQRFDTTLNPIGPFFRVNFAGSDANSARVASDGTNYLVVWREDRFAYNEIFAARVSAEGQVLDPNGIKLFGSPGDFILNFNTSVAWDGTAYVTGYHARPVGSFDESVYANRVQPNGIASAPIPVAVGTGATQPGVGSLASGGSKIVWVDRRQSVDGDIFGADLSPSGTLSASTPVSLAAPRETNIRFTRANENFAYVYRSAISGEARIYLQRTSPTGDPVGEPTLVTTGSEGVINPSVAFNGSVYLVVWELAGQTFGRRVGAEGTPLGSEFLISIGNTPDVASLGSQFLVVNSFPRTNQLRHTQATRVGGDGTVAAPVRIGNNFDLRPRVRAFGTRWLAVWESDISHDNPNSNISAAFVEPDGTSPGGEFSIGGLSADAPALAVAGDSALVVWMEGSNIVGRRILSNGTFPAPSKIFADAQGSLYAPAIAFDGARYVLTYADATRATLFPPADIYATLIGIDGTILTPGGFAVAASTRPEEMPAVEGANGIALFGYSQFDDRPPYASYRVRIRRFPFDLDFNISATPFQRNVAPGATTDYTVSVNSQSNFAGTVELRLDGLPNGATAAFVPTTIAGSGNSTLTIATVNSTPEGIYRLTISGTSGAQQSTVEIILNVDDAPPPVGYTVTDLGSLGGNEGIAYAINSSGQVVGYSKNASQKRRAFLYQNGQLQDLNAPNGTDSTALGINSSGMIVGYYYSNAPGYNRAFSINSGTFRDLGALSQYESFASGINSAGMIVGSSDALGGRAGFVYQNDQMQQLPVVSANAINTAGKIVGSNSNTTPAYVYFNGQKTSLGTLGGTYSVAWAINDNDQIVGSSDFQTTSTFQHAFRYQSGTMVDLNPFNAPQSFAYGINASGKVVGSYYLTQFGNPRAFLHDGTNPIDLNTLISQTTGWTLNVARDINDSGQIVGQGTVNGQLRPFLLTPNTAQNIPPTVQITSPTTNANIVDPSAITISAAAADADGTVVRVEFYADGNLIGTATSSPFTFLWTTYRSNRTYTLTARAFDNAGAMTVSAPVSITTGINTAIRQTRFDFDGDRKADVSIYRPSDSEWWIWNSSANVVTLRFGESTDKIVPGDYTGDGKADVALWRPSDGQWYVLRSEDLSYYAFPFGANGDIPVPGDYDGDGKTDPAVFRPSNGGWYVLRSSGGVTINQFGFSDDKPVAADYDGDGKIDIAVYRPSTGVWHLLRSRDGYISKQYGIATDNPVAGDYDGDGRADLAVYRDGVWWIQRTRDGDLTYPFGVASDKPVPADYDGDGKDDIAVFRDGVWYVQRSTQGFIAVRFGAPTDVPTPTAFLP